MNRHKILVVDDLGDSCSLIAEFLREQGYLAGVALGGQAALSLLAKFSVDLVLTDHRMPGMDGVELIQNIRATRPDQKALLMTGFGSTVAPPGLGLAACLRKPIDIEDLLWAVDSTLACVVANHEPSALRRSGK